MTGAKTNERPGTRAILRHERISAYKVREVLDLIRGQDADRAAEILRYSERRAAQVVAKVLASAVANAQNNDDLDPEELYVSACYADEGTTLKRWRPRARGRATRIRKRSSHITVIVARMSEERIRERQRRQSAGAAAQRARRVAGARRSLLRRGGRGQGAEEATEVEEVEELSLAAEDRDMGEAEALDAEARDAEDEVDAEDVDTPDGAEGDHDSDKSNAEAGDHAEQDEEQGVDEASEDDGSGS
ncbi:MAG: 50S ribosomal protein L22 [Actinomycetota bacterium]|nr:50S ribosomal protein L22 [Actinomycetota bacterium]